MRILQISASGTVGTRDMGPISTGVCRLANGLARRGHEVTVIDAPAADARSGLDTRVTVVTVPSFLRRRYFVKLPAKLQLLWAWIHALFYVLSLRRRVRLGEFDVVHVHDVELAYLLGLVRAPYYYTSHSTVWALKAEGGTRLSLGLRIERGIERFAILRSRMSIGLGDYLRRQMPDAPVTTIPNGIEAARWQPIDKSAARRTLGIDDDEFVVVFTGRIHPNKGVDLLVEATRSLHTSIQRLRVFAIGPPGDDQAQTAASPYAAKVMDRAKGLPVQFTGFIPNHSPQFRTYLAAADVAVIPSRVEPFGNVALEALMMSVPVIAARTGGLAEIVSEDVGVLVPPNDVQALAGAIRDAHAQPEKLAMRRARCRRRVMEEYTVEQFVGRHAALFERGRVRA